MTSPRHFIDLTDFDAAELRGILTRARQVKSAFRSGDAPALLAGKTLGMIFEKNSTRTRVSFEMAMRQLGGHAMFLSRNDLQLGRGESLADTARVLSRYVDALMLRANFHQTVLEMAQFATIPVVNGLTNKSHPCQIMADILTVEEHRGSVEGKTFAWIGDGNNVLSSLIHAAAKLHFSLRVAAPRHYWPGAEMSAWAKENGVDLMLTTLAEEAANGVDAVFTDTWVSMGDEEPEIKIRSLRDYQVNAALMRHAKKDAIFLHCLPAHRGEEVTDDVIDGPQSVVFDEAENRLHVQKAILLWCLAVTS